ncbi:MAG: crossover junction endodeoxyribonuclease RuvC [Planctomycetota bacterium]
MIDRPERILGIDPGLRLTGYGCVELAPSGPAVVEAGVFRLVRGSGSPPPVADRLVELADDLRDLIGRTRPDRAAVEGLFAHYRHPATAVVMAHARGVILLELRRASIPVTELKPAEVKKSMAAHGAASKAQIQQAVMHALGLPAPPSPADVADALAIALTASARSDLADPARTADP